MYSIVGVNLTPFYFLRRLKINRTSLLGNMHFFLDNDAVANNSRRMRDTAEGREVQEKVVY